jgi:DNA-binding response OmpR family regulator
MDTAPVDATPRKSILIIDDEVVLANLYVTVLQEEGFDAFLATSIEEALGILKTNSPSVILLDCKMPLVSGEEIAAALKEHFPQVCAKALLVGFSSFEPDMKVVESFKASVDRFVRKPDDIEMFVKAIHELVALAPSKATKH